MTKLIATVSMDKIDSKPYIEKGLLENIKDVVNRVFNNVKVVYSGIDRKNLDAIRDAVAELEERY